MTHKYRAEAHLSAERPERDSRSSFERLTHRASARGLWTLSILLLLGGIAAVFIGVIIAFGAVMGPRGAEVDEFVQNRRVLGTLGFSLMFGGVAAMYGSYRFWGFAREALKRNRRRARGRE